MFITFMNMIINLKLKYSLAFVDVSRVSDIKNTFTVRIHLGHLLNHEDHDLDLDYDLHGANFNDVEIGKYKDPSILDIIFMQKTREEVSR